jgi:hypothetical protein
MWFVQKKIKVDAKIMLFTRYVFVFFAQATQILFYYKTVSDDIECVDIRANNFLRIF